MAQLRQNTDEFARRNTVVLIAGPDGPRAYQRHWEEEGMLPLVGLADVSSKVAKQYDQEVNLLKLGRMPAMFVIDATGIVRYSHYGRSMEDIPETSTILQVLDQLAEGQRSGQQ